MNSKYYFLGSFLYLYSMAFIDTSRLKTELFNLIGWRDFYDATEIPATGLSQTPESGEFYNTDYLNFDLDVIKAGIPTNRTLAEYLTTTTESGITYMANKLKNHKILKRAVKSQLQNFTLFPVGGMKNNTIAKSSRFVGIRFQLRPEVGIKVVLPRIGFQFDSAQTDLPIYLFHSSQDAPISTFNITTPTGFSWYWINDEVITLTADSQDLTGGYYYLGYYEDDVTGNAITFKNSYFDWSSGFCSPCGYRAYDEKYKKALNWLTMSAISVNSGDFVEGEVFSDDDVNYHNSTNFGINFNLNIECDITNYIVENSSQFTTMLGNCVAYKIMKGVEYSQQNNFVTDDLAGSVQVELNGLDTNEMIDSIAKQIQDSVAALTIDQSELSSVCFPCYKKSAARYGVA